MTIPQTKSDEAVALIDELTAIKYEEAHGFEFGMARLKRMIQEIEKSIPGHAYSLWGAYYSLLGNKQAAHMHYALAIQEFPLASWVYGNYAASLLCLEECEMSLKMMEKALELDPSNLKRITDMLYIAKMANKEEIYIYWLEKYNMLITAKDDISSSECFRIACQSNALRDWERSEEDDAWNHLQ